MGKFLLVVVVLGVLIYLTVRVIERRGIKPTRKPTPRPLGPDDDLDFLWDLDKKKRHQKPPPPDTDQPSDTGDPSDTGEPGDPGEPGDEAKPA